MKDLHGIHIPGHKNTSAMKASKLPLPQSVVIPIANPEFLYARNGMDANGLYEAMKSLF